MAERLRDLRRPRPALRPAPGHLRSLDSPRQRRSRTTASQCEQVMPGADRRRGQRHPARRHGARRVRRRTSRSTSRRPARPAPTTATWRCGSSATPRRSPRPRWSPAPTSSATGHPQRPGRRRHLHRAAPRLDHRRPDVGRGDGSSVRPSCPTRTSRRRPATRSRACSARCPTSPAEREAGDRGAPGRRVHRRRRRPGATPSTGAGLVASTSPEGGVQLSSGDTVTIYTSTGYVPRAAGQQRRQRVGGKGKGTRPGLSPAPAGVRPELPAHLGGHGAAVGTTLDLRRARRPSPCPWPACPRPPRRSARSRR